MPGLAELPEWVRVKDILWHYEVWDTEHTILVCRFWARKALSQWLSVNGYRHVQGGMSMYRRRGIN